MSGWLMVLAVLAASVTYHAGLNPPGGFWQHNDGESHVAGTPVLQSIFPQRYTVFFYFNATAFVTSVVIIILLMNESFYHSEAKVVALEIIAVLDMVCLMGAYIAGSTRAAPCSIYVTVLTVVVFLYVVYAAELLRKIWWLIIHAPVHDTAATGGGKLPAVPQHIVEQASPHHPLRQILTPLTGYL
uniref:PGG domain-containing protein n=1 Tax=Oryza rufipogon TaxID=4529 RepID=A0A0E0PWH0_ORYRU